MSSLPAYLHAECLNSSPLQQLVDVRDGSCQKAVLLLELRRSVSCFSHIKRASVFKGWERAFQSPAFANSASQKTGRSICCDWKGKISEYCQVGALNDESGCLITWAAFFDQFGKLVLGGR